MKEEITHILQESINSLQGIEEKHYIPFLSILRMRLKYIQDDLENPKNKIDFGKIKRNFEDVEGYKTKEDISNSGRGYGTIFE